VGRESLAQRFGASRVLLLNDFAAVACALPFLAEGESVSLGPEPRRALHGRDFNVAVLGPGTGLGVAGLLGRDGALYPVVGEGGHRAFAPETARQIELLELLRRRFERVSYERLLSGPGLENVYAALSALNDQPSLLHDAAGIFAAAGEQKDPLAVEAVALFFEILGQLAGDIALEMSAVDGIYIAGGIVQRYPELLAGSAFRAGFEHKGRHRALLEKIPTQLITHADPGLLGAAYCARLAASAQLARQGS
jgi:glucokinase